MDPVWQLDPPMASIGKKVGCGQINQVFEPKPRKRRVVAPNTCFLEENLVLQTRRKPVNIP